MPYYAPNPLRGGASSFAKASEDMSKGARGGRGEEKFEIRPAVVGSRMCGRFRNSALRRPACAGLWRVVEKKVKKERTLFGGRRFNLI